MNQPTNEEFLAYFKASDSLFVAAAEFVSDWRKGDFTLSELAACDARSLEEKVHQYAVTFEAMRKPKAPEMEVQP
jgi:hypothetical protein